MPKIKGWKRWLGYISGRKAGWKTLGKHLEQDYLTFISIYHPRIDLYTVEIVRGSMKKKLSDEVIEKEFKTKTKAMKYAINWMKKHPRG